MSDALNLRKDVTAFNKSERFDAYSKIIINVTDDLFYEAGNDTGRTLTLSCPWGTKAMANNLLAQMRGFSYQPYTAEGAILDPASELGDGINVKGVYSGIYRMDSKFTSNCPTDISAPSDEEIDYEYQYQSKQNREVKRKNRKFESQLSIQADRITAEVTERKNAVKTLSSKLNVQANQIEAKVSKTGNYKGADSKTFGWELSDSSWVIKSNNVVVLKATRNGIAINGIITATSGTIGGFDIKSKYISYNKHTWKGTNTKGIYIGVSGIKLGTKFKVDNQGNLTASSGKFTGSVYAEKIVHGETGGYVSGNAISSGTISGGSGGQIASGTVTTGNLVGGINTSLGYADFANGVFNGWNKADTVSSYSVAGDKVFADELNVSDTFYFGVSKVYLGSIVDGNGEIQRVVQWKVE